MFELLFGQADTERSLFNLFVAAFAFGYVFVCLNVVMASCDPVIPGVVNKEVKESPSDDKTSSAVRPAEQPLTNATSPVKNGVAKLSDDSDSLENGSPPVKLETRDSQSSFDVESAISDERELNDNESESITDVEDNDEDAEEEEEVSNEEEDEVGDNEEEEEESDETEEDEEEEGITDEFKGVDDRKDCRIFRRNQGSVTDLPETVTVLETAQGSKVYLVGTAHFSLESQEDVSKTIEATQPDVVVVELCKGRVSILQLDEATILQEAKNLNFEKIRATIRQNGFVHGIMYLFLLNMSAHLTKQLGMAPGGEFRRAFAEARKVPGCIIHLGDRPIQVTLHRALAELSFWQKLCLAVCLITSKEPISKEEVERCKKRDLLEEMLAEMTGKFPAFSRVFVTERDVYLTHSLQLAAAPVNCNHTESGYIPSVVVGVVGIGHVPGIVENWGKVVEEDIPPLLRIPESSLSNKIVKYAVKASVWCAVAWGCYKILGRTPLVSLVQRPYY